MTGHFHAIDIQFDETETPLAIPENPDSFFEELAHNYKLGEVIPLVLKLGFAGKNARLELWNNEEDPSDCLGFDVDARILKEIEKACKHLRKQIRLQFRPIQPGS